jgi:hypothetical protein
MDAPPPAYGKQNKRRLASLFGRGNLSQLSFELSIVLLKSLVNYFEECHLLLVGMTYSISENRTPNFSLENQDKSWSPTKIFI